MVKQILMVGVGEMLQTGYDNNLSLPRISRSRSYLPACGIEQYAAQASISLRRFSKASLRR